MKIGYGKHGWELFDGDPPNEICLSKKGKVTFYPSLDSAQSSGYDHPGLLRLSAGIKQEERRQRLVVEQRQKDWVLDSVVFAGRQLALVWYVSDVQECLLQDPPLTAPEYASSEKAFLEFARLCLPRFQALVAERVERSRLLQERSEARRSASVEQRAVKDRQRLENGPLTSKEAAERLKITVVRFRAITKRLDLKPANVLTWKSQFWGMCETHQWDLITIATVKNDVDAKAQRKETLRVERHAKRKTAWFRILDGDD